jgi:hypothetical protein
VGRAVRQVAWFYGSGADSAGNSMGDVGVHHWPVRVSRVGVLSLNESSERKGGEVGWAGSSVNPKKGRWAMVMRTRKRRTRPARENAR